MSTSASKNGKVYLVGAGPGDPGSGDIARKGVHRERGRNCLRSSGKSRYRSAGRETTQKSFMPGNKRAESRTQQEINALLLDKAREGKQVVRLKGGDPFVFGRGAEEAEVIADAGIPFEIVPGITSAIAGPAYAGIPMTHREQTSHVTFFTGHEDPAKTGSRNRLCCAGKTWRHTSDANGVERLGRVTSEMLKHGVRSDLPVALVAGQQPVSRKRSQALFRISRKKPWRTVRSAGGGCVRGGCLRCVTTSTGTKSARCLERESSSREHESKRVLADGIAGTAPAVGDVGLDRARGPCGRGKQPGQCLGKAQGRDAQGDRGRGLGVDERSLEQVVCVVSVHRVFPD